MKTSYSKTVCDRCGNYVEVESITDPMNYNRTPKGWQDMRLDTTGARLDLCETCNESLLDWLEALGAKNMKLAVYRDEKEVL